MELMGVGEFLPTNLLMDCLASLFCHETEITQGLCTNILFVLCGFDEAQVQRWGWLTPDSVRDKAVILLLQNWTVKT